MAKQYSNSDTAALYRSLGFTVDDAQHWNHAARVRVDTYHAFDLLAFRPDFGIVGIQATTGQNLGRAQHSLEANEACPGWKASGGHVHLVAWRKIGPKGGVRIWAPLLKKAFLVAGKIQFELMDIAELTPPDEAAAA